MCRCRRVPDNVFSWELSVCLTANFHWKYIFHWMHIKRVLAKVPTTTCNSSSVCSCGSDNSHAIPFLFYFYRLDHYAARQMNIISKTPLYRLDGFIIRYFSWANTIRSIWLGDCIFMYYTQEDINSNWTWFLQSNFIIIDVLDSIFHTYHVPQLCIYGWMKLSWYTDVTWALWYTRTHFNWCGWIEWANKKEEKLHVFHLVRCKNFISALLGTVYRIYIRIM